jgi:hypothetical protein
VLTSIPPGTFQANSIYSYVTINGMHLGTNCPKIMVVGNATFSNMTNCTDTSVAGTLQTSGAGTATFSAGGNGYNGNGFVQLQQQPVSPSLVIQILQATCTTPQITGLTVNGTQTNAVIAGTSGVISLFGLCLSGTTSVALPQGFTVAPGGMMVVSGSQVNVSFTSLASAPTGASNLTLTATNAPAGTAYASVLTLKVTLTSFSFTNSAQYGRDCTSNFTLISQATWPAPGGSSVVCPQLALFAGDHALYASGDTMKGTAVFSVSPAPPQNVNGLYTQGVTGSNGTFLGTAAVTISAGSSTFMAPVAASMLLTPGQTQFINPLSINWCVGQGNTSSGSCVSLGASSNPVYVTLVRTRPAWEPYLVMLTYASLAVGNGGAATPAAAFQNTWNLFSSGGTGPVGVSTWDGRQLGYYLQGVGFNSCAVTAKNLVEQNPRLGVVNSSGQCGAFQYLLADALAMNGISLSFAQTKSLTGEGFMVKQWVWNVAAHTTTAPGYSWYLRLYGDWGGDPALGGGFGGMFPPSPNFPSFGDMTTGEGIPGQNSADPSEKVFGSHYFIWVNPASGVAPAGQGPYFDPSYGVWYLNQTDFETKAVAFYTLFQNNVLVGGVPQYSQWVVRQPAPSGPTNMCFALSPSPFSYPVCH